MNGANTANNGETNWRGGGNSFTPLYYNGFVCTGKHFSRYRDSRSLCSLKLCENTDAKKQTD